MTTGPDTHAAPERADDPITLVDAEQITPPPWPQKAALQAVLSRTRQLLGRRRKPFMDDDRLRRPAWLDEVIQQRSPVCTPALNALTRLLNDSNEPDLRLIMLPPCDDNALLDTWAARHGLDCLAPPEHGALLADEDVSVTLPEGDGVLVIPDLGGWFLRHHHGLRHVRALLAQLGKGARACIIGCNSWTWAFLCKAVQIDLILPAPLTFSPLEEMALRRWFADEMPETAPIDRRFRLSDSGRDLLALDERGRPDHDYFRQLAARSLGIPWVAWHLWQRSLRERIDPDEDDRDTLWVVALEEISLPGDGQTEFLLILHALLIHGALPGETLSQVLPDMAPGPLLQALESNGYIARHNGWFYCQPGAYPAIRRGLEAAGFPMDLYG
ncbi:hypothetical protein GCM10010082_14930 [Kushneria pakistanensis]|uniref:Uncharacterized protein n=1 Tax=Kushneria pakistanensis TaxID=1508770 RepID=A0ABQ3FGQ0_9GAMM|nr:hypothetical protein [Kushneria pakistanensis]GHC23624.1 hypothetical protein GCM10010082_14930 [Kushneria pakistanensis]